ncbi:MAG: hypothetical protein KA007_01680 [Candidatus Pacebacteria bacterium]|jgi:hypothetical protein|nr:hypothetical protein [Candidatus Paceibacterota bacterium]
MKIKAEYILFEEEGKIVGVIPSLSLATDSNDKEDTIKGLKLMFSELVEFWKKRGLLLQDKIKEFCLAEDCPKERIKSFERELQVSMYLLKVDKTFGTIYLEV